MEAWRHELYHHGIKGQRWGVRNGPPYPLGASDHSASEKKAGWRRSLRYRGQDTSQNSLSNSTNVKTETSSSKPNLPKGLKATLVRKGSEFAARVLWAIGEYPLNSVDDLKRIGEYAVRRKFGPFEGYDAKTGFKLKKADEKNDYA